MSNPPPTGQTSPAGQPSPTALLLGALATDGARPLVTFYDDATGERVELSVVTFENWVAKTANLMVDGLGLEAGSRVALLLPAHWQTAVWLAACWRVGATAVLGRADGSGGAADGADLAVVAPDSLDAGLTSDEVVALSLRPLGGRFTEPLPAGVVDYAVEVPGHGDRFAPRGSVPEVLEVDGTVLTGAAVMDLAEQFAGACGLEPGGRLLSGLEPSTVDGAIALLPAALARGGSVVLQRNADPAAQERRVLDEKVTATALQR